MEYDGFKPRGATKASKADAGGAVLRTLPLFGVVKNNIDPIRAGRLQVYISDLGGSDPNDSSSWSTVSYMSPFYGVTTPSSANTGWGNYIKNPHSYGIWNSPPDIGTTVICMFLVRLHPDFDKHDEIYFKKCYQDVDNFLNKDLLYSF